MAAQPHDRRLYPAPDNGHQFRHFAPPQAVANRVRHPPIMQHSTGSAFRPHGASAVPSDNPFVPRGHIPSTSQHYHQQQPIMPSRSSNKHIVHPHQQQQQLQQQLQQQQQQQQMNFQNVPLPHPFNKHPQVATDLHPNVVQGGVVQPVTPQQYARDPQTYVPAEKNCDPEAMHQELRMLHALHYQEKLARQQQGRKNNEMVVRQQMMHKLKGEENPHVNLRQEILTREDHPLMQHEHLLKERAVHQAQQTSQPRVSQERLLKHYEDILPPRRRSLVGYPQPNTNQTDLAAFIPEVHSRLTSPAQQNIHQVAHGNFAHNPKRYPNSMAQIGLEEYRDISRVRQTSTPPLQQLQQQQQQQLQQQQQQQSHIIMPGHKPVQRPKPVEHHYPGDFQNPAAYLHRRSITTPPNMSGNISVVKPHSQQHPLVSGNQRVPARSDHVPARQASYQAPQPQMKQHYPHNVSRAVEKQTHPQSLHPAEIGFHQAREKQRENETRYLPRSGAYCEPRRSTSPQRGFSIKQEQMLIKEKLELSLQQASSGAIKKEAKPFEVLKNVKNTATYPAVTSSGMESMPRIVEVRSLANQETRAVPMTMNQGHSKNSLVKPDQVDVIPSDIKPTKPKALMIKTHQELYEAPAIMHRVSSRSSMDSENGRKDSWDSGIESPTLSDVNRENNMYVKRGTTLPYEAASSVKSLQHHHNLKAQEYRGLEKSHLVSGLDLCSKMTPTSTAAAALDFRRSVFHVENSDITSKECKSEYRGTPANPYTSSQLSTRFDETIDAQRKVEVMPKKRTWPIDDCPVQPKTVIREEKVINDCSAPEDKTSSIVIDEDPGSSCPQEQTVLNEFPLDLTVKKEALKADVCTKEESVPSKAEGVPSKAESVPSKVESVPPKEEKECPQEDKASDLSEKSPSDSQLQGYFGTIMMRALKRLWATTRFKLDVDGANIAKPECTESSDEDSGKYFKPSAVTTLDDIPGTDKVEQQTTAGQKNLSLPTKGPGESLENVICELMQHSSGAFKHGSDIFQHFDTLIKRELLLEMENQALNDNEASTSTEVLTADASGGISTEQQVVAGVEDQSSEAIALHCDSPSFHVDDQDMDESQNLVIVESSMSPKVSPDSQEMRNVADDDRRNFNEQASSGDPEGTANVDSSISSERSSENVYAKAARLAVEKAAREAANKASKDTSEYVARVAAQRSARIAKVLSSPQEDDIKTGENTMLEIIDVESGLSPLSSTSAIDKPNKSSSAANEQTRLVVNSPPCSFQRLYKQQEERISSINFSNASNGNNSRCSDEMMGDLLKQARADRCLSAPVDLTEKSAPNVSLSHSPTHTPLPRRFSEDNLVAVKLSREQISPSAEVPQQIGKVHPKIASNVWQAQGVNANKVKLMKVPSSQGQPPPLQTIQDKGDMQRKFQRSPIVILPKIVCIPGQSYPAPPPVSVVQSSAPRNVVIIQQDQMQQQPNPVSVINTSTVVQTPPSSTVQFPVYNFTAGGSTSTSPTTNTSPVQSGPISPKTMENVVGPFRIMRKSPLEPSTAKKPNVSSYIIVYKNVSLPGVVRSGVPFVPPKMLQEGMFPSKTFERFCLALQESNIMQRYMTVLERSALLPDLRQNKISSCKLVSLEEFHEKYDNIQVLMEKEDSDEGK